MALASHAQIHGVPASVTSLGPRGYNVIGSGRHGFGAGFAFGGPRFAGGFRFGHFNPGFRVVSPPFFNHRFHGSRFGFSHRRFNGSFGQSIVWPVYAGGGYQPVIVQSGAEEQDRYEAQRVRRDQDYYAEREDLRRLIAEELAALRAQPDDRRAPEAPPAPAAKMPANAPPKVDERPATPTILVFQDGRRVEVQNYAIVGPTIYEFTPERRKLVLAELDVDTTVKVNEERGVIFKVPTRPKGKR
jgi:hypothetical protein